MVAILGGATLFASGALYSWRNPLMDIQSQRVWGVADGTPVPSAFMVAFRPVDEPSKRARVGFWGSTNQFDLAPLEESGKAWHPMGDQCTFSSIKAGGAVVVTLNVARKGYIDEFTHKVSHNVFTPLSYSKVTRSIRADSLGAMMAAIVGAGAVLLAISRLSPVRQFIQRVD